MSENYFKELARLDVSEHLEKKGKFNYLSWAYAVKALKEYDPTATWEVIRFDGLPYLKSEVGYFVEVSVTVMGISQSQIHPVLNNYNKPIEKPNSFDINTSIQRCLVKAIAQHGLGIWVYAGEDLPNVTEPVTQEQVGVIKTKALQFAKMRGKTDKDVFTKLKINDVTKINSEQAEAAIKQLEAWIKKAEEDAA